MAFRMWLAEMRPQASGSGIIRASCCMQMLVFVVLLTVYLVPALASLICFSCHFLMAFLLVSVSVDQGMPVLPINVSFVVFLRLLDSVGPLSPASQPCSLMAFPFYHSGAYI